MPLTPPSLQPGLQSLLDREYDLIEKRRVAAGDTNCSHASEDAVGVALSVAATLLHAPEIPKYAFEVRNDAFGGNPPPLPESSASLIKDWH